MHDALTAYLATAGGITVVTRQRATAVGRAPVAQGEATAEQVAGRAEDLVSQSPANREAVSALVTFEVDRTLGRVGLASSDEVRELSNRVRVPETEVRKMCASAAPPPADGVDRLGAAQPPARAGSASPGPA